MSGPVETMIIAIVRDIVRSELARADMIRAMLERVNALGHLAYEDAEPGRRGPGGEIHIRCWRCRTLWTEFYHGTRWFFTIGTEPCPESPEARYAEDARVMRAMVDSPDEER